jgi:hypothetical protein
MSLMNWFEDKRRFGGLIGALIEKETKGYILSERKKTSFMLHITIGNYKNHVSLESQF